MYTVLRGQPVTLRDCAGLSLVWAQQAVPTEVRVGAEARQQKKTAGFAEPEEEESTSSRMCSTAASAATSAQLRPSFL